MSRSDKVIVIIVLGFMLALFIRVINHEAPDRKCIDDKVHRLTNNGYWVAYNIVCKPATIEEKSE